MVQRKREGRKREKERNTKVEKRTLWGARGNCIPLERQRLLKWAKLEFDEEYGVCTLLRDERPREITASIVPDAGSNELFSVTKDRTFSFREISWRGTFHKTEIGKMQSFAFRAKELERMCHYSTCVIPIIYCRLLYKIHVFILN